MSVSSACHRSSVHSNGVPFFVSSIIGLANAAKSFRIVLWKKAGALHILKYMTSGIYVLWRVWMAALCRSSLARQMLLYPWRMLNLENNVLPWSLSIASRIPGIGLWSRTVQAFTLL